MALFGPQESVKSSDAFTVFTEYRVRVLLTTNKRLAIRLVFPLTNVPDEMLFTLLT